MPLASLLDDATPQAIKKSIYSASILSILFYLFEIDFAPTYWINALVSHGGTTGSNHAYISHKYVSFFLSSIISYLCIHLYLQRPIIYARLEISEWRKRIRELDPKNKERFENAESAIIHLANISKKSEGNHISDIKREVHLARLGVEDVIKKLDSIKVLQSSTNISSEIRFSELCLETFDKITSFLKPSSDTSMDDLQIQKQMIYDSFPGYGVRDDFSSRISDLREQLDSDLELKNIATIAEARNTIKISIDRVINSITKLSTDLPNSDVMKMLDIEYEPRLQAAGSREANLTQFFSFYVPLIVGFVGATLPIANPDCVRNLIVAHPPLAHMTIDFPISTFSF